MKHYSVKPSSVKGEIYIPPSKSHTLRAILFAALAKGKSIIHNFLPSTDATAMIEACRLFGAKVTVDSRKLIIEGTSGQLSPPDDVIHAGNSGIVLRFCAAVGALLSFPVVITGDHSIRHQRPMQPLLDGLAQLNVSAHSTRHNGYAPIIIQGPLKGGKTVVEGQDSQHVSALLIASAFAEKPTEIEVKNPGELPWVALTLDWFDRLGISYKNHNFEKYRVDGGSVYEGFEYTVPGDFSSAAFPLAAALVTNSEITLHHIEMSDPQGDKELVNVFQKMGAKINIDHEKKILHVSKGANLKGIEVDINNFVDAITILSVVACYSEGETHIRNAAIARKKECNRIECIARELKKMGADIVETNDGLIIRKSELRGANLHSYQDHRMVMSLTVAALGAKGESTIGPVECVAKTFPTFLKDFSHLGVKIEEIG